MFIKNIKNTKIINIKSLKSTFFNNKVNRVCIHDNHNDSDQGMLIYQKKNPPVLSTKPIWLFFIKLEIFFVKIEKKINIIKKVKRYEIPFEKNKLFTNLFIILVSFPPKL